MRVTRVLAVAFLVSAVFGVLTAPAVAKSTLALTIGPHGETMPRAEEEAVVYVIFPLEGRTCGTSSFGKLASNNAAKDNFEVPTFVSDECFIGEEPETTYVFGGDVTSATFTDKGKVTVKTSEKLSIRIPPGCTYAFAKIAAPFDAEGGTTEATGTAVGKLKKPSAAECAATDTFSYVIKVVDGAAELFTANVVP